MTKAFFYDKTFDGLLTAVFDAYSSKTFPDRLLKMGEPAPLFTEICRTVYSDEERAQRVWTGLQQKLPKQACNMLLYAWLSEIDRVDELLFRYIRKIFDGPAQASANFGDADVLEVRNIARKVSHEALYLKQFVRFSKTADQIYFAPVRPIYNALSLVVDHFANRFADQQWIIYDMRRKYGYFYNLHEVSEIVFAENELSDSKISALQTTDDDKLFQQMWKEYFKALAIKERINPRLQRKNMPVRFWQYLTEYKF